MDGIEQLSAFSQLDGGDVNVLLMLCFATLLAWSNGANDIANSVGTSVGAGAISLRVALVIGSVSEFLGCLLMGGEVAKTVGEGVVNLEEWDENSDLLAIAMTAVLAGAGISTASATAFGLPVSATHGAISGLTAVALYDRGAAAVNGRGLAFTVFGWVASPLVGGLVGGALQVFIERQIFSAANPAAEAHRMRPTLVAGTLGLIVVFLCSKGPKWLRLPWWGDCLAFVVTVGISMFVVHSTGKLSLENAWLVLGLPAPEGTERKIDRIADGTVSDTGGQTSTSRPASPDAQQPRESRDSLLGESPSTSEAGAQPTILPRQSTAAEMTDAADSLFAELLVLTGCTVAFAHGGNDVGNSTGPLLIALAHSGGEGGWMEQGLWLPILGGLCFVLGIVTVGSRTIATVGSKITKLTKATAFSVQSGATLAVLLSTAVGLPVSTSHCLVGALIGVGIAGRYTTMEEDGESTPRNAPLDFTVLKKIVLAWVVTIPLAVALALAVFVPLRATLSVDVLPPYSTCEMIDGDCPASCPAGQGNVAATPTLNISELCSSHNHAKLCMPTASAFSSSAHDANVVIESLGASDGSDILKFDDTKSGLHMSILYTCCHTTAEVSKLHAVLKNNFVWDSFEISYSDVGCNVDTHEADIVYLHAMPDEQGQNDLLQLAGRINDEMRKAGIPVRHPRKSLFHMTLARVTRNYPTDRAVAAAKRMVFADAGLRLRLCRFTLHGKTYTARDTTNCL